MRILFLLFLSLNVMGSEARIEILAEAFVQGPTIQLGEIAKFENLSKEQTDIIQHLTLADAPSFGEVRSFSSQALAEMLRSKLPDKSLMFEIPSTVTIKNVTSKIDVASVRNRIIHGIKMTCADCEVVIKDLVLPEIATLSVKSTWDITTDWNRVRGSFQLPLEVVDGVGKKAIHWLLGKALLNKNVVVMKRDLVFGERIQIEDLEIQTRDITYRPDAVTNVKEAVGALTKVPVSANTLLNRNQIQKPPAMVRGQSVTVRAKESGWNVTIKGVAEQNAIVGDTVKVLNPQTRKVVVGVVVEDGVVEVR